MDEPPRIPDPWSWRYRGHTRTDPRKDQIGIGRRHPLLGWLGVWVLGIAVIAGLSLVLPARTAGVVAIVIILALLTTTRI